MPTLRYVVLSKPIGVTPLMTLTKWRESNPSYKDTPATYAGRLDPMASGKLLILLGEECKNAEAYRGLDKQYDIEVVFGIATDTGDALGVPTIAESLPIISRSRLEKVISSLLGSHEVPYPPFSSKTVNGVPLFQYALDGTLDSIDIPTHTETLYSVVIRDVQSLTASELENRIATQLSVVPKTDEPSKLLGDDFRQDTIRSAWTRELEHSSLSFCVATLSVTCASGTYMRTLAQRIARELETTGFALSIHRSKIGIYKKFGPIGFWNKLYC